MLQAVAPIAIAVGVDDASAQLPRVDLLRAVGVCLLQGLVHAQPLGPSSYGFDSRRRAVLLAGSFIGRFLRALEKKETSFSRCIFFFLSWI